MRTTTPSEKDVVRRQTASWPDAVPSQEGEEPAGPRPAGGQRRADGAYGGEESRGIGLPGSPLAARAARQFVRTTLADWTTRGLPGAQYLTERVADEAELLASELVTNAVVHAGTSVELLCRLDEAGPRTAVIIEVSDHHPARPVRGRHDAVTAEGAGRGLQLVGALADAWGITYRRTLKTVWFRVTAEETETEIEPPLEVFEAQRTLPGGPQATVLMSPGPQRAALRRCEVERIHHGALSFLAEASDLLSGQLDADQVAALVAQLIVPRMADWCAVWLDDGDDFGAPRLARVWHATESRIDGLRELLVKDPPVLTGRSGDGPAVAAGPWPWPGEPSGSGFGSGGAALACPLVSGVRRHGTLLIGRAGLLRFPDEIVSLIEDLAGRVARAIATADAYSRQERISRVLQRRLLPGRRADVPGVASAVVYEPREGAWAGGDFWDLFRAGEDRWCFMLGDVCGSGPEAAAVTGLARPVLRLLAREGYGVGEVLDRLNRTVALEAADSVAAVAAAVVEAGSEAEARPGYREESEQARFLSLLYGEIVPHTDGSGGARCTIASAGHPLPLVLGTDGTVRAVAGPQILLGVLEDTVYESESFDLAPGETLLCVTDGVTERRSGSRLFDDEDGLAHALAECAGLGAEGVAEHLRRRVHAFGPTPPDDDLALLVLQAVRP
ncbi:protein phosphatase [Streptomyces sp. Ru73]|uniref:SpoIIE family protein phosphatase n=1 Tax=Streptomyces sp. Ru73 TaxID=2080748 RepID=UPI000CDDCBDF|nr:SpoIIE family protein phosphatase [Streptomyces sp. Ru73]POX36519.1 protein phosphatase [Streptomyces sp. Ru73]